MTTWYFPSWNGDIRIEDHPDEDGKTIITMTEPTASEQRVLKSLAKLFGEKGWMGKRKTIWNPRGDKDVQIFTVQAPLQEIGIYMIGYLKPGLATLTAVNFENGKVEAKGTGEKGFLAWLLSLFSKEKPVTTTTELADLLESGKLEEKALAKKEETKPDKKEEKKVTTVTRPTPSCPHCIPGSIEPATEVLLSFLDEEQHHQWAKDRSMIVVGGLTGHRYLLAHRNSKKAQRVGRICYDIDDGGAIHFHDNTVPPEEEVLAAKLILEHRETWLRNEATCLGCGGDYDFVFKNPFGGLHDGVADSNFTGELGGFLRGFLTTFQDGKFASPEDRKASKMLAPLMEDLFSNR